MSRFYLWVLVLGVIAPVSSLQAQGFDCNGVTEIPVIECEALVALYNSTDGPNWYINTDWVMTNTPCSWPAVTCALGRVSRLLVTGNNLTGTIPSELGNLSSLTLLSLSGNNLTGTIPPELGSLSNLVQG